jgi:hypothetical protein
LLLLTWVRRLNESMGAACAIPFMNDPKHWRDRAADARALASEMRDLDSQAMMLRLADDYDNLAIRAEKRAHDKPPSSR